MQDAARPGKLRWAGLLALHTIIFVIGYGLAIRIIRSVAAILTSSGAQISLETVLNTHWLWTAFVAGFLVGLIGVTGIEAAFGRIGARQSLIEQPSLFVCVVFAVWFAFGVLRWTMTTISQQQSVLAGNSSRWLASFVDTFFLADCASGWWIGQINFDSCSNQLAYTTLFVGSLGYAASRLIAVRFDRNRQIGSTVLTADDHSLEEQ